MIDVATALFVSMVTCVVTVTYGTHYPDVINVDNNCYRTISVQSDVRIRLSSSTYLDPDQKCLIYLVPHQGSAVVARFLEYSMPAYYANEYGNCQQESIQMTDSTGNSVLGYQNYCRTKTPPVQINLLSRGSFGYTVQSNGPVSTAVVDLLVSEVVTKKGSCPSGYFDCQNTLCVTGDVVCNGYDDCGNNRDEISGCVVVLAAGVIVAIAIGVTVFVIIVIVVSLLFRRHRLRARYMQYP